MPLGLLTSLVVLGSAFMHAAWNALVKTGDDRMVTMAVVCTVWLILGGALAAALPLPARGAWPFLAASVPLQLVYLLALLRMYRLGDLSQTYPIARGTAPPVLALLSALAAGEWLAPLEWLGVAGVSLGILVLALPGTNAGPALAGRRQARAVRAALLTGVLIVCYTFVDGLGVRRAGSAPVYAAWLFMLVGIPWAVLLVTLRLRRPGRVPARLLGPGLLAGALSMLAYSLIIWALGHAPMGPVAALRETGVIFAALLGTLTLGEPFGRRRVLASALVALGVTLLNLPG